MLSQLSRLSQSTSTAAVRRLASTQCVLTEEIAGVPPMGKPGVPAAAAAPSLSTTGAGLKLVQHEGQVGTTLTLVVGAGARDEDEQSAGSTHLLKHLAFKNSQQRSELRLGRALEDAGCTFSASASRDTVVYQIATLPAAASVETGIRALAETAFQPRFKNWDLDTPKAVAGFEFEALSQDAAAQAYEEVYAAAFHDATLGRRYFNEQHVAGLSADVVAAFHAGAFGADRSCLVVSGAGASGADVTALVNQAFGDAQKAGVQRAAAAYKGGEARVAAVSGVAHVALALEGAAVGDADQAALAVLAQVLGGSHHAHSDTGLFVVSGSAASADAAGLVDSLAGGIKKAAGAVDAAALEAAKARAKLAVAGAARDERAVALGLRALNSGSAAPAGALAAAFEAVSAADVQKAAQRLLKSQPTIASVGSIANVPRFDAVQGLLR